VGQDDHSISDTMEAPYLQGKRGCSLSRAKGRPQQSDRQPRTSHFATWSFRTQNSEVSLTWHTSFLRKRSDENSSGRKIRSPGPPDAPNDRACVLKCISAGRGRSGSKENLQCHLPDARIACGKDHSEGARAEVSAWIHELSVVKDIEVLGPELGTDTLRDPGVLQ